MISLRATLEKHFNMCMVSIQQGLPEVEDEEFDDKDLVFESQNASWTCPTCKVRN